MRLTLLALLLVLSCSAPSKKIESEKSDLSILISHNINGEIHPCGCRQFPFGGIEQVFGLFTKLGRDREIIYIDTGDTFFPSQTLPDSMKESLKYAADSLYKALGILKLNYFVPGEQDLAMGLSYLQNIANSSPFTFLIANLKDPTILKHKKFEIISYKNLKIFLVGIVDPETMPYQYSKLFLPIRDSLSATLNEIKSSGYDPSNPNHKLILLSHSGMQNDKELVKSFPDFDWVIGSHSQSYTTYVPTIGKTRLVQVLSKNHHIGEINLTKDSFKLYEIRDELKNEAEPNPLTPFVANFKKEIQEIQKIEQRRLNSYTPDENEKLQTATSCIECHKKQGEFWQKTPHSLAYLSLIRKKSEYRTDCISCHSLGFNNRKAFVNSDEIFQLSGHKERYLKEIHKLADGLPSDVRKLPSKNLLAINKKWVGLDKAQKIEHNFANVSCLNCHDLEANHPFSVTDFKQSKEDKMSRCLSCHTNDQSPAWYETSGQKINKNQFEKTFKNLSCPKG